MIEYLLEEGRKILAKKSAAEQAKADAEQKYWSDVFFAAKREAERLFAPLRREMIEPAIFPGGDWRPNDEVWFWIRLFDTGTISVRLKGYDPQYWQTAQATNFAEWKFESKDNRHTFYVASNFEANEDGTSAHGRLFLNTNSLAEALAMCERESENYRKCLEEKKARIVALNAKKALTVTTSPATAAENLYAAIRDFVDDAIAAHEDSHHYGA